MSAEKFNIFQGALNRVLSPEGMANVVLPLAGMIETIATKGQSPGTVATAQRQLVLDDVKRQKEQDALEWERKQKEQIYADQTAANKLSREASQADLDEKKLKQQRQADFFTTMKGIMEAPDAVKPTEASPDFVGPRQPVPGGLTKEERASKGEEAWKQYDPETYYKNKLEIDNYLAKNKIAMDNFYGKRDYIIDNPLPFTINPVQQAQIDKMNAEAAAKLEERNKQLQAAETKKAELYTLIEKIKNHPALPTSVGGFSYSPFLKTRGTQQYDFVQLFQQLKAWTTSENLNLLKGNTSDKDIEFIKQASSALDLGLSQPAMLDELNRIQQKVSPMQFAPPGASNQPPAPQPTPGITRISSDAEYDALPSGTPFIDPTGQPRRKP